MRSPGFGVVTLTLVILTVTGAFVAGNRDRIPPPPPNALEDTDDPYLRQAMYQPVRWEPLSTEAFTRAQREQKAILVLVGAPWSAIGRRIDRTTFQDQDLANFMTRSFVCVRVDGNEFPEWMATYFPVSRVNLGMWNEFQIIMLDPNGTPFEVIARTDGGDRLSYYNIMSALRSAQAKYVQRRRAEDADVMPLQESDLRTLATRARVVPDFASYQAMLRTDLLPAPGTARPYATLRPNLWRFLLTVGDTATANPELDRLILSPMFDLVHGGFFRQAITSDLMRVTFDKLTVQNAEMAAVLAHRAALSGQPADRRLAEITFDAVAEGMRSGEGIASCLIGDERRDGRSPRYSFETRRLEGVLSRSDRATAELLLNLRPSVNPLMVPYLSSREDVLDGDLEAIRQQLQRAPGPKPEFATERQLDVEGLAVARLFEAARLLRDSRRQIVAEQLNLRLDDYLSGGNLARRISPGVPVPPSFYSFLAFADAKLEAYLSTGFLIEYERGLAALREAARRFRTDTPGLFRTTESLGAPGISLPATDAAEIVDNTRESTQAQWIRLATAYGRLADDANLLQSAQDAIAVGTDAAIRGTGWLAGYYRATAYTVDARYVIVVGVNAVSEAGRLQSALPGRFVAPAVGNVRTDLQAKAPGIYIVEGGRATGPLSSAQVRRILLPILDVRRRW